MLPVVSATPIPMGICVAFVNSAAKLIKDPNISSGTGPVAPVGPSGPVTPVEPVGPGSPVRPVGPVGAMLKGKWL